METSMTSIKVLMMFVMVFIFNLIISTIPVFAHCDTPGGPVVKCSIRAFRGGYLRYGIK